MKKIIPLVLSVVLALAVCAGCGGGHLRKNSGPVSVDVDENVTATLTVATKSGAVETNIITSVAEVFNKTYKNVTVKIKDFSGDTYANMMSAVATEDVPDITIATSFEMFQLHNSGVLMNLQPYIDAETKAGRFDVNDYYTTFMKAGQENFDGDQYLIPRSADRVVCHYNADLLRQADTWYKTSAVYDAATCESLFDLVVNGWTWDDFMFVCSVVRAWFDATGRAEENILDSYFNWEAVWNPIFASYGVQYIDADKTVKIDSQQTRDALEFMKSLRTKKYTGTTSANFYGGKGVFFFQSQSALDTAKNKLGAVATYYAAAQNKDYDSYYNVVTMPVKEGAERIGAGVAGYCVSAYTKVGDIAWKFLKTLLSQEGQNALSQNGTNNYVPVRKDMANASEWSWGKDLDGINLSAYTYNAGLGGDPDWNCFTDFFLVKPSQALNLLNAVNTMVNSYVFDLKNPTLGKTIGDCESAMQGFLKMR